MLLALMAAGAAGRGQVYRCGIGCFSGEYESEIWRRRRLPVAAGYGRMMTGMPTTTWLKRSTASQLCMRMHPCEA